MTSYTETLTYRFFLDEDMHPQDQRELTSFIRNAGHRVVKVKGDKRSGPRSEQYAANFLLCDPQDLPIPSGRIFQGPKGARIVAVHYHFAQELLEKTPLLHPGRALDKMVEKAGQKALFMRKWYGSPWQFWLDPDIGEEECLDLMDIIEVIYLFLTAPRDLAKVLSTRDAEGKSQWRRRPQILSWLPQ
jgi:hypothetical protein